jgi:hypothetical protein
MGPERVAARPPYVERTGVGAWGGEAGAGAASREMVGAKRARAGRRGSAQIRAPDLAPLLKSGELACRPGR